MVDEITITLKSGGVLICFFVCWLGLNFDSLALDRVRVGTTVEWIPFRPALP